MVNSNENIRQKKNILNKDLSILEYFKPRLYLLLFNKTPNHAYFNRWRLYFLKKTGMKLAGKNIIFSPIHISPKTIPENIEIGVNTFINSGCRFSAPKGTKIKIGKNSLIGPNVCFETVNHFLPYRGVLARGAQLGDIIIEEGVWICMNSLILQNSIVRKGCVIAAQSTVNSTFDASQLIGGTPAKIIKDIKN